MPHDEKPGGYFVNRYQGAHPVTYGQQTPAQKISQQAEEGFKAQW